MSPEDRRAQILDAAIPVLITTGAETTTRQIAEAAGIAEGTVFRVFEDKQALVDAAVVRVMDEQVVVAKLEQIDQGLALEAKVARVVEVLRRHVQSVMRLVAALGPRDHARHEGHAGGKGPLVEVTGVVTRLLSTHRDELRVDAETAVDYLRILVFGTSMPFIRAGREVTAAELTDFILRGISRERD